MRHVAPTEAGAFTGRHMLMIMIAFFAVVIAVNVTMATVARTSWTGLVVANSYVASQEFNGRLAAARAQAGLGWTASLVIEHGEAHLTVFDRDKRAAPIRTASLALRSPATDSKDRTVVLERNADGFRGRVDLADGQWVVEIEAGMADGGIWRETRRMRLVQGSWR
ncbi:MAG: FixH family protein [Hyphomicrobiales bacterium]|nr:FixH family protein [Hyphomicrobiales bacterium]